MQVDQIQESIDQGYENGNRQIEVESANITLLPYGESLSKESKDNGVIIYKDLFDKKPLFFIHEVLSLLGGIETVSGSETDIKEIPRDVFDSFCNEYHFSRGTNSKIRYGLFYKDELVMVAGFSKPKKTYKNDEKIITAELYRVVKNYGVIVEKGLEKLIEFFIKEFDIKELRATIDNEFDEIKPFIDLKFKLKEEISPSFSWLHVETNERFSSGQLIKKNLLRKENLNQMVHPPKGYLPIQNMGHKEIRLVKD